MDLEPADQESIRVELARRLAESKGSAHSTIQSMLETLAQLPGDMTTYSKALNDVLLSLESQ